MTKNNADSPDFMTNTTPAKRPPETARRKPANSGQTHAEFLQSLREAHAGGRPISYFRQWPTQYLIEAGLPQDWLQKCGLIQPDGAAPKLPNQCSQRQFAEIVSKLYGKPINQAAVSRAIKDGLNVAVTPSNGRLRTDAALRWWENNKSGVGGSAVATEAEDRAARQRIARQREEMELEVLQRQQSGKWISTDTASQIATGTMRQYHDFLKARLESTSLELFEVFWQGIGLTPEQVAASKDFLIKDHWKVIDDIETHAEQKVKEYSEQLKTEISYAKSQP